MAKYFWLVPFLATCLAFVLFFIDMDYWFFPIPLLLLIALVTVLKTPKGGARDITLGCLITVTVLLIILLSLFFWFFGTTEIQPK